MEKEKTQKQTKINKPQKEQKKTKQKEIKNEFKIIVDRNPSPISI
jgi:hypothetical protein